MYGAVFGLCAYATYDLTMATPAAPTANDQIASTQPELPLLIAMA
ncbi:hypothetical protein X769_08635 [Mesorhizobium sp. LSJC268A00]|nr:MULTISPECIES: hypothetical protein [unclassified Mesorhizobium]ESX07251.1 hypothetical protein X769_08635 [Mesorhizobium sp. LSJC268A00]ESX49405.1 hypothetical protein X762_11675 [Mesorhizobium sp. LSHC426A00]ESX55683.1 hypothetical protein X761_13320 [Mesorhizobium sp. LSHC424B00]ESX70525.1 hypothetical protein X758_17590 [Mesorhizobium sp. LSHC416B00]ESY13867.1 hypothetical protein X752_03620 [Mesorhizobium sp. LNJC398B00]